MIHEDITGLRELLSTEDKSHTNLIMIHENITGIHGFLSTEDKIHN